MAKIHPFKAIRPTRDKAQLVSTRPMYAYRAHILKAKLDENPYTFLHIIHPFDANSQQISEKEDLYKAVKSGFENFITTGILMQDELAHFYIYRQTKNGVQRTGIIAGASVEEYKNNAIKKHEATITKREQLFTTYLKNTGFNAEPVLLTHQPSESLNIFLEIETKARPEYEFSTTDKIKHELWILPETQNDEITSIFATFDPIYIADGHHRSSSSSLLVDEAATFGENKNYFLSYFLSEDLVEIIEFNRLIKHINGHSISSLINTVDKKFHIELLSELRKPIEESEIVCYFEKTAYSFRLKEEFLPLESHVKQLSVSLLSDFILEPILGLKDLKTNADIEYIPGTTELEHLTHLVDSEIYKIAFLLHPLAAEDIRKVADENGVMPPKSTYIEPKLRSGLTIYRINE